MTEKKRQRRVPNLDKPLTRAQIAELLVCGLELRGRLLGPGTDATKVTYDARLPNYKPGEMVEIDVAVEALIAKRSFLRMVKVRERGRP